jgi:hypothetical protein
MAITRKEFGRSCVRTSNCTESERPILRPHDENEVLTCSRCSWRCNRTADARPLGKSSTYPGLVVALSLVELFIVLLMLAFVVKPNRGV